VMRLEVKNPADMDPVLDMDKTFTTCLKCRNGVLLPLSDTPDGAPIMYKAGSATIRSAASTYE